MGLYFNLSLRKDQAQLWGQSSKCDCTHSFNRPLWSYVNSLWVWLPAVPVVAGVLESFRRSDVSWWLEIMLLPHSITYIIISTPMRFKDWRYLVCAYIPEISTTTLITRNKLWLRNDPASKSYPGVCFLESLRKSRVLILTPQKKSPKGRSIHR